MLVMVKGLSVAEESALFVIILQDVELFAAEQLKVLYSLCYLPVFLYHQPRKLNGAVGTIKYLFL